MPQPDSIPPSAPDFDDEPISVIRVAPKKVAYQPTEHDIKEHMHLVHKVVAVMQRKLPTSVQRDNLLAAGTAGLLDAIRKSHANLGTPEFECYARIRIRGAILDALRQLDWSPRRHKQEDGEEAAPVTVVGFDDLAAAQIPDGQNASPLEVTETLELHRAVDEAIAKLPERDRKVLELRYVHDVPAKEIAVMLGISEARVSQLHSRATSTLRGMLAEFEKAA